MNLFITRDNEEEEYNEDTEEAAEVSEEPVCAIYQIIQRLIIK